MDKNDLISRQAAIDALKNDMASLDHIIKGMSAYDVRLDAYVSQRNQVDCDIDTINNLPTAQPEQHIDADGTLWITVTDIERVKRVIVDEDKSKFCRQFYMDAQHEQHHDEWCTNCKEYDTDRHCCPRWNRVIRQTLADAQPQRTGYWYPVGMAEAVGGESAQWGSAIAYHKCSECDEQALRDDFEQEVLSKWCPHCGVKMMGVSE